MTGATPKGDSRTGALVRYFLRLGLLGFGGPVALVGQMERELVTERGWLTEGADARSHRRVPIVAGTPRHSGGIYVSYLRGGFGPPGRADGRLSFRTSSSSRGSAPSTCTWEIFPRSPRFSMALA